MDVDRPPASRITRLMTEPRVSSRPARPAAGAEHELGGVLGAGRTARAPRPRRSRRPRGTCRRARRAGGGGRRACSLAASASPSSARTCTPMQLARGPGGHARRPPDQVVAAGRTGDGDRRRAPAVSHGVGDPVALAVVLERLVDPVGHPQQRQLAQRRRGCRRGSSWRARRRPSRARRCCRGPCGGAAPRASCRPARSGRRRGRPRRGPSRAGGRPVMLLDDVVERLEVLDVDRRDDVDAGVEQLLDVLPALGVARARARWCGPARRRGRRSGRRAQDGVEVHLLERRCRGGAIVRRGTTSRSPICSAVRGRSWVST